MKIDVCSERHFRRLLFHEHPHFSLFCLFDALWLEIQIVGSIAQLAWKIRQILFEHIIWDRILYTTIGNQWNGFIFLYHIVFHANRLVCELPSSLKNCLLAVTIIYLHFTQKHIFVHDRIPSLFELSTSFCAIVSGPLGISSCLRNNVGFSFFSSYSNEIERKVLKNKVIMQNASKCPFLRQSFQKFHNVNVIYHLSS